MRADFPAEPASAGRARRFVDATLRTWECNALVDVASLLVSELVANSVLHAGTPITVVITRLPRRLRIEVQDGDARVPALKHYSTLATTGRGLMLVERMASDWGVRRTLTGKGVWFELDQSSSGNGDDAGLADFDLESVEPLGDAPSPWPWTGGRASGGGGPAARPRVWVLVGTGA